MLRLILTFLLVILPSAVVAASFLPLENQPVHNRVQPGFAPVGARMGDVLFYPSLRLMETYNDNIYAAQGTAKSADWITGLTPGLQVQMLNSRHGAQATFSADHADYRNHARENFTDLHGKISPYWHVNHAVKLQWQAAYDRAHDARISEAASNNIGAEEPVRWSRVSGKMAGAYQPGRTGLSGFVRQSDLRYDNVAALNSGAILVNDDRNRQESRLGLRLGHYLTDRSGVDLRVARFVHDYRRAMFNRTIRNYAGPSRDSSGHTLRFGIHAAPTPLIHVRGNGGYYHQNFADPRFRDVDTGIGQIKAVWQVTALTTLDASTGRKVFETIQPDASTFIQHRNRVAVTHELRRNVIAGLAFVSGRNTYTGSHRRDDFHGVTPHLVYHMNRYLDWKLSYLYDHRESSYMGGSYDRQQIFIALHIRG